MKRILVSLLFVIGVWSWPAYSEIITHRWDGNTYVGDLALEPGEDHRPEEFMLETQFPDGGLDERSTIRDRVLGRGLDGKRRFHPIARVEGERSQDLFARAPEVVERIDAERCLFGELAHRQRLEPAPAEKDPRSLEDLLATRLDIALPQAGRGRDVV